MRNWYLFTVNVEGIDSKGDRYYYKAGTKYYLDGDIGFKYTEMLIKKDTPELGYKAGIVNG